MITLLLAMATASPQLPAAAPLAAAATVDSAIASMGGARNLARIQRVRREMLTQWVSINFSDKPFPDRPSYELHTDTRDYELRAWRNERHFGFGPGAFSVTDIVLDTVAIRQMRGAWGPLNIAYVDERRELFAFAPERMMLVARAASDLRAGADTIIDGQPNGRILATIDGFPAAIFLDRGTHLPTMARFRAAEPNDFGLAPWGEMDVEFWYSGWAPTEAGALLPTQWDVRRVHEPYKRMTVLGIAFDTVTSAESFAVSDSLRRTYLATSTRPMHDLPLDSARVVSEGLVTFGGFGAPSGAVKVGGEWVLLETGQSPFNASRAIEWLGKTDPAPIAGAIVTHTAVGNGGMVDVVGRGTRVHVAPAARPLLEAIMRNHGGALPDGAVVGQATWLRVGSDSLWMEPLNLPDTPGTLVVYSPSLRWVYTSAAANPMHRDLVVEHIRNRGWPLDKVGSLRAISAPLATESG